MKPTRAQPPPYLAQNFPQICLELIKDLKEVAFRSITYTTSHQSGSTSLFQKVVAKLGNTLVGVDPVVVTTPKDTKPNPGELISFATSQPINEMSSVVGRFSCVEFRSSDQILPL
jgi:hypothetical protein